MHLYFYTPSHLTVMAATAVTVLMAVKVCVHLVYLSLQEDTRAKFKVIRAVLMQIQVFWNMTSSRMTDTDRSEVHYEILLSYPCATLSTTNATRTDLELHLDLHNMKMGTNYLNHGTGTMHTASNNLPH
jgi:hypothetical protein